MERAKAAGTTVKAAGAKAASHVSRNRAAYITGGLGAATGAAGTRTVGGKTRKWYHLWSENENAVRPVLTPYLPSDWINSSSVHGIPIDANGATPTPNTTEPKWGAVSTNTTNTYTVTGKLVVGDNNVELSGENTPTDVVVNKVQKVEWVSQAASTRPGTPPVHLAKLETHDGAFRAFPEKTSPTSENFNVVEAGITLVVTIPDGMWANVYVGIFDPKNPKGSTKKPTPGPDDNHGSMSILNNDPLNLPACVKFNANESFKKKEFKINAAYAGDNYIVAIHPNPGIVNKYRFKSDGTTLERPDGSAWAPLDTALQTKILTVWRTLWIELDRMYVPSGLKPNGEPADYQISNTLVESFPPNILAAGGKIATELARACIVPKEFTPNDNVEVPGAEVLLTDDKDEDDPAHEDKVRRQITELNSGINGQRYRSVKNFQGLEDFWVVQVVNAFKNVANEAGSHKNNIIFMFVRRIRQVLDDPTPDPNGFNIIYPIILLHEIGHALWLEEALDKMDNNAQPVPGTTYGVMLNKGHLRLHLVDNNDKFRDEDIPKIQAMGGANRPK